MTKSIRRVAVIGAGPAGAIATDALVKEQAFDEISVFDRQATPGGTWVLSSNEDGGIPSLRDLLHQNVNQALRFSDTDIDRHSEISRLDPETGVVTFSDGSSIDNVDIVLFATGYDFSFPFLPGLKSVHKRIPGLYQIVFKIDDPTLTFIGMVTGGFGIRIFEWQAVATARVLAGHAKLPSHEEMEQWEIDRLAKRGDGSSFWTLMPDFEEHFGELRDLAGDPAPGTTGRVLPRYRTEWADTFWKFIQYRIDWWRKEARIGNL